MNSKPTIESEEPRLTSATNQALKGAPWALVLFDGDCGFCSGWVRFMVARDRRANLRFAPLQGSTAAQVLRGGGYPAGLGLGSMVLVERVGQADQHCWTKSDAALRALGCLGGFWNVVRWLRFIPKPLRDWVYDQIAKNRFRLPGGSGWCRLPSPSDAARFLP
jgi:predicted DCC family thiol-disulfide oxidoreductase YuxK